MESEDIRKCAEVFQDAKQLQKSLGVENVDTALLILMHEVLEEIRFNTSN